MNVPQLAALVRHFFERFFDTDMLSERGEAHTNVVRVLAFLAVPGLMTAFYLLPRTSTGVEDRYFYVCYSMIVMGFVMVFEWDSLFPDRRDYLILTPLPIRPWKLFTAKIVALCIFLTLFVVDINLFAAVLVPAITTQYDPGSHTLQMMVAHAAAVFGGGAFTAMFFAALQGVLINLLTARAFRWVSPLVQMLSLIVLVAALLLFPLVAMAMRALIERDLPWLYYWPCFWFLGVYEILRPGASPAPAFYALAKLAGQGLSISAAVFAITYLIGYQRHARRALESIELNIAGPGRLIRWWKRLVDRYVALEPGQRGAFYFIGQTLTRSAKHRLFLATYMGVGVAIALIAVLRIVGRGAAAQWRISQEGLLAVPLTLSFFLLSGLRAGFNFPIELRANWAFQLSESERRSELLAGVRKWCSLYGIAPLFALLAVLEFACWPWYAALYHLSFGVILSLFLIELLLFQFRKPPFACAYFPGKANMAVVAAVYVYGFTTYAITMVELEQWLAKHPLRVVLFYVSAVAALRGLAQYRDRELKEEFTLVYEDEPDPVVRTLNLSS